MNDPEKKCVLCRQMKLTGKFRMRKALKDGTRKRSNTCNSCAHRKRFKPLPSEPKRVVDPKHMATLYEFWKTGAGSSEDCEYGREVEVSG